MCKFCYEHTRKICYLQPEAFDIRSGRFLKVLPGHYREWFDDFLAKQLDGFVDENTADINQLQAEREPYTGLKKQLYNYFAKNILGGQVTGSLKEVL